MSEPPVLDLPEAEGLTAGWEFRLREIAHDALGGGFVRPARVPWDPPWLAKIVRGLADESETG